MHESHLNPEGCLGLTLQHHQIFREAPVKDKWEVTQQGHKSKWGQKGHFVTFRPGAETLLCEELEGGNTAGFFRDPLAVEGDGGSSGALVGKDTAWETQKSKLDNWVHN